MRQTVLLILSLLLGACTNTPSTPTLGNPSGPQQPAPDAFDLVFTPASLSLTNREKATVTYELQWHSYRGRLSYAPQAVIPSHPNFKVTWQYDTKSIQIDATGAPAGEYKIGVIVSTEDKSRSVTCTLKVTVTQDPRVPAIQAIASQRLQPGGQVTVPIRIEPPANGTPIQSVRVSSPDSTLVVASLLNNAVVLQASATAPQQGLIPVTLEVVAGNETASRRIPVQIGDLIDREFERFNALRAQGNMAPVTFDAEASMNCWMHGRYRAMNNSRGHNENPNLPYASPEGLACASNSNLSTNYQRPDTLGTVTPFSDRLFSVPFHAVGMLRPGQQTVGIGAFAVLPTGSSTYATMAGGITSQGRAAGVPGPLLFPGNGATTDLSRYPGGEWPNPLTACPGLDARQVGLPIIAATLQAGDTTATEASLTVNGQSVPICAYGSTQYVNTTDAPGDYVGGPVSAQDIGRSILRSSGAVFLIPAQPLVPNTTYQASVKINGQPIQWSFKTASSMRAQTLQPLGKPLFE